MKLQNLHRAQRENLQIQRIVIGLKQLKILLRVGDIRYYIRNI